MNSIQGPRFSSSRSWDWHEIGPCHEGFAQPQTLNNVESTRKPLHRIMLGKAALPRTFPASWQQLPAFPRHVDKHWWMKWWVMRLPYISDTSFMSWSFYKEMPRHDSDWIVQQHWQDLHAASFILWTVDVYAPLNQELKLQNCWKTLTCFQTVFPEPWYNFTVCAYPQWEKVRDTDKRIKCSGQECCSNSWIWTTSWTVLKHPPRSDNPALKHREQQYSPYWIIYVWHFLARPAPPAPQHQLWIGTHCQTPSV